MEGNKSGRDDIFHSYVSSLDSVSGHVTAQISSSDTSQHEDFDKTRSRSTSLA